MLLVLHSLMKQTPNFEWKEVNLGLLRCFTSYNLIRVCAAVSQCVRAGLQGWVLKHSASLLTVRNTPARRAFTME